MKENKKPLKEITSRIIERLSKDNLTKRETAEEAWRKAVGKKFLPHTQPASFRKKRLIVNVDESAWLYELTIEKKKIAARLRKALKDDFKELRFRIGKIER